MFIERYNDKKKEGMDEVKKAVMRQNERAGRERVVLLQLEKQFDE